MTRSEFTSWIIQCSNENDRITADRLRAQPMFAQKALREVGDALADVRRQLILAPEDEDTAWRSKAASFKRAAEMAWDWVVEAVGLEADEMEAVRNHRRTTLRERRPTAADYLLWARFGIAHEED